MVWFDILCGLVWLDLLCGLAGFTVWFGLVNERERSGDTSGDERIARCHAGVVAAALLPPGGSVVRKSTASEHVLRETCAQRRNLKYELIKDYKALLPVLGRL